MRWWRASPLARSVVMILLLWTAADVTDASLCALDSDDFMTVGLVGCAAPTIDAGTAHQAPQSSGQVDDCFCCSHCVDLHPMLPPLRFELNGFDVPLLHIAVPIGFDGRIYHPPLV